MNINALRKFEINKKKKKGVSNPFFISTKFKLCLPARPNQLQKRKKIVIKMNPLAVLNDNT